MLLPLAAADALAALYVSVPSDYPTIADALAADPGLTDIVIDAPGDYTVPYRSKSLAIRAAVADVFLVGFVKNDGTLKLTDIAVRFDQHLGIEVRDLVLTNVDLSGDAGSVGPVVAATGAINAAGVTIHDLSGMDLFAASGTVVLDRVTIRDAAIGTVLPAASTAQVRGLDLRCSSISRVVAAASGAVKVTVDGALIADSVTTSEPEYFVFGTGSVAHVTLWGDGGTGFNFIEGGSGVSFSDVAFFHLDETNIGEEETSASGIAVWEVGHDEFGASEIVANEVDPHLAPGDCTTGYWPQFGSPLVDAGNTGKDRDESRPDVGATGGEDGLELAPDADTDGVNASRDCDDTNPSIKPGAEGDVVGDGLDTNCDLVDGVDSDRDTFASVASGGDDCDDASGFAHPGQDDVYADDIDADCDGIDGTDGDGDGYATDLTGGPDCDDADPAVHPGAVEDKGGADLDCDGEPDTGCGCDSGGAGGWAFLAAILVARRRRR